MDNLEILILSAIVTVAFLVFIITSIREFMRMEFNEYQYNPNEKKYGRDALFNLLEKLFEDETIGKDNKKEILGALKRTISDMESDGIYFSEDIKSELQKQRDELYCEYSGLPSPKSYETI
jgi:hypothetical protein